MLIKVCSGELRPDAVAPDGLQLWQGGYGGDDDRLPAAVLPTIIPEFEIGKWYTVGEFEELLTKSQTEEATPTTIDVAQMGVGGPWSSSIEVSQELAARILCESVLGYVKQLEVKEQVWLWVE